MTPAPTTRNGDLAAPLTHAFAPIHKLAFGVAIGIVTGVFILGLTAFHVVMQPRAALDIGLLAQYFYGFDVTWLGAVVGLGWGFATGFIGGWFLAFVRNLVLAVTLFALRTRAEFDQAGHFLDNI